MKTIVTGGAGFIGSQVVDRLIEEGHEVVVIDNLSTGKESNINKKAKFYNIDIQDQKVSEIFEKEKPDYVNHHAAQIDLRLSIKKPILDAQINILGLINILDNSVKHNVKKFIYVSSAAVYGIPGSLPVKEDVAKLPLSPYGIGKWVGELYLNFYNQTFGLNYTTLRYSNVYGPRQQGGEAGVVSIFIRKVLAGDNPIIFGDGKQTRDYVFVSDVVDANILALTKGDKEAFNIGTGVATSVNDLFSEIKKITNHQETAEHAEEIQGELKEIFLDSLKAEDMLGWKSKTSLNDGLNQTYNYFKNLI